MQFGSQNHVPYICGGNVDVKEVMQELMSDETVHKDFVEQMTKEDPAIAKIVEKYQTTGGGGSSRSGHSVAEGDGPGIMRLG